MKNKKDQFVDLNIEQNAQLLAELIIKMERDKESCVFYNLLFFIITQTTQSNKKLKENEELKEFLTNKIKDEITQYSEIIKEHQLSTKEELDKLKIFILDKIGNISGEIKNVIESEEFRLFVHSEINKCTDQHDLINKEILNNKMDKMKENVDEQLKRIDVEIKKKYSSMDQLEKLKAELQDNIGELYSLKEEFKDQLEEFKKKIKDVVKEEISNTKSEITKQLRFELLKQIKTDLKKDLNTDLKTELKSCLNEILEPKINEILKLKL